MKIVRNRLRPDHGNIIRHIRICAQQPATLRPFTAGIKMHDLAGRMHACICAAGTDYFDRFVGNPAEGFLYVRLNAVTGTLALPAVVRGTVVFDAESNSQSGLS